MPCFALEGGGRTTEARGEEPSSEARLLGLSGCLAGCILDTGNGREKRREEKKKKKRKKRGMQLPPPPSLSLNLRAPSRDENLIKLDHWDIPLLSISNECHQDSPLRPLSLLPLSSSFSPLASSLFAFNKIPPTPRFLFGASSTSPPRHRRKSGQQRGEERAG